MTPPLVSVEICTRDRPQDLPGAVASVLAQTYRPIEIVIVDHASSVRVVPPEVPEGVTVQVLRVPADRPLGAARDVGLRAANGPLIAFLDDDDRWRPDHLDQLTTALATSPAGVVVVEGGFVLRRGQRLVRRYVPAERRRIEHALLRDPYLQPSTVLARRDALVEVGGFDHRLQRCEDWELWLRVTERYGVTAVPTVVVDRAASDPDPATLLAGYREMVARLTPRIDRLPFLARRDLMAYHRLNLGVLLARCGERRTAARTLAGAWVTWPLAYRSPLHLVGLVVGERGWEARDRFRRTDF